MQRKYIFTLTTYSNKDGVCIYSPPKNCKTKPRTKVREEVVFRYMLFMKKTIDITKIFLKTNTSALWSDRRLVSCLSHVRWTDRHIWGRTDKGRLAPKIWTTTTFFMTVFPAAPGKVLSNHLYQKWRMGAITSEPRAVNL